MKITWITLNNKVLNLNELTGEEYEQYWDDRVKNYETWTTNTYLGPLTNQDNQVYCESYHESLDPVERAILKNGIDGTLQRDVWNQVMFCSENEYEMLKNC